MARDDVIGIGIGASAGGVEATTRVVRRLPADLPALATLARESAGPEPPANPGQGLESSLWSAVRAREVKCRSGAACPRARAPTTRAPRGADAPRRRGRQAQGSRALPRQESPAPRDPRGIGG